MKDKLDQHRRRLTPEESDQVWNRIRSGLDGEPARSRESRPRGWWPTRWQVPVTALGAVCVVVIALVVARRSDDLDLDQVRWGVEESAQAPSPQVETRQTRRSDGVVAMEDFDEKAKTVRSGSDVSDRELTDKPPGTRGDVLLEAESGEGERSQSRDEAGAKTGAGDGGRGQAGARPNEALTEAYRPAQPASPPPAPAAVRNESKEEGADAIGDVRMQAQLDDPAGPASGVVATWSREYRAHPKLQVAAFPRFTLELSRGGTTGLERLESALESRELPPSGDVPVQSLIHLASAPLVGDLPPMRPQVEVVRHPEEPLRAWLVATVDLSGSAGWPEAELAFALEPEFVEAYRLVGERTLHASGGSGGSVSFVVGDSDVVEEFVAASPARDSNVEVRAKAEVGGDTRKRAGEVGRASRRTRVAVVDLWLNGAWERAGRPWGTVSTSSYDDGAGQLVPLVSDLRSWESASPSVRRAVLAGTLGDLLARNPWSRAVDVEWLAGELRDRRSGAGFAFEVPAAPSTDAPAQGVGWARVSELALPMLARAREEGPVRPVAPSARDVYPR